MIPKADIPKLVEFLLSRDERWPEDDPQFSVFDAFHRAQGGNMDRLIITPTLTAALEAFNAREVAERIVHDESFDIMMQNNPFLRKMVDPPGDVV